MYILQITENKLMMMIVKLKQSVLTQISNHSQLLPSSLFTANVA